MRSFVIALLVLVAVVALVVFNSLYITNLYDELADEAKKLPENVLNENCERQASAICEKLDHNASYLYTVIRQQNVDELLIAFSEVLSDATLKHQNGYTKSLEKARLVLNLMKDNEAFPSLPVFFGESKKRYFP